MMAFTFRTAEDFVGGNAKQASHDLCERELLAVSLFDVRRKKLDLLLGDLAVRSRLNLRDGGSIRAGSPGFPATMSGITGRSAWRDLKSLISSLT